MRGKTRSWLVLLVALLTMAAVACSSGDDVSQEDYDAVNAQLAAAQADLTAAQSDVTALQAQVSSAGAQVIVQAATDDPAMGPSPEGWETPASLAAGVQLLDSFDSSGDDAWDVAAHPDVFVTSEGIGYAGFESEVYNAAGLQIIDAMTYEHVASAGFDLGFERMGTPHGLGVSPDGRWIYVPTADGAQPWRSGPTGGRLLVVNARTLKLHQVIGTGRGPHHVKGFTDPAGNDRIVVETQGGPSLLLDPNDDHRVVFQIGPKQLYGQAYQVDADLKGENLYIGLTLGGRGVAPFAQAAVAKVNIESGQVTYITDVGQYPNGFAFTSDGLWTYVADSSNDRVYKIDNTTNKSVGSTQAAVPGPYMVELNHDETELWVVGKGEMTYNLGGSLGLIDLVTFDAVRDYYIGGQTIDHNSVNPFQTNELWVTSSGTAETIVFDMEKREVKTRIPDANGGDTHSGAFVHYNADWTGELVNDNGGVRGSYLAEKLAMFG
ncbi:MAG: hypothetical protein ACR2OI_00985 [Acidimicrobiia bacterium]